MLQDVYDLNYNGFYWFHPTWLVIGWQSCLIMSRWSFFFFFCWFFFGGGKDNMDEVVVNVINIVMNSIWANMKVIFSSKNLPFNFNSQLTTTVKWSQLGTLKHQNQWKYHESKLQYWMLNVLHYIMHVVV
jgi:hypothetical protein